MAYPAPATMPTYRTPAPMLRSVEGSPPEAEEGDFASRAAAAGVHLDGPLTTGVLVVDLAGPLTTGGLVVDLAAYVVTLDGETLDLSPRQVELLALFLGAPRRVWSRDQLHRVCWGDTAPSRRVDVQLCRLRAKTGMDMFRNVRDRGWALRSFG